MNRTRDHTQQVRELIDIDSPADDLQRLARMDALLRAVAAAGERRGSISPDHGLRPHRADKQMHELKLTFSELALVLRLAAAEKEVTREQLCVGVLLGFVVEEGQTPAAVLRFALELDRGAGRHILATIVLRAGTNPLRVRSARRMLSDG